ncbi:membrane-spanning 4-domains subfamily A member 4D isoform X2 [Lepisosteus oculatus]|uniref:membrane-spanning 4-domains subfamily A member 4D isoform X1 n=1 Tax=Lepisosteus oculatus TaxID=7918 RepID=UPI0035F521F2
MASFAGAATDDTIELADEEEGDTTLLKRYEPAAMLPSRRGPLEMLLKKEPAALGALQILIGTVNFGLGIVLAVSSTSLVTILKVPFVTGFVFVFSGLFSVLVKMFPRVLPICLRMNFGSFLIAGLGMVVISVDLSFWTVYTVHSINKISAEVKGVILCLTLLEMCITAPLTFWTRTQIRHIKAPE